MKWIVAITAVAIWGCGEPARSAARTTGPSAGGDGDAARKVDTAPRFPVVAASGPFGSVDEVCDFLGAETDDDGASWQCRRGDDGGWDVPVDGSLVLSSPPPPFVSVRIIAAEGQDISCYLLMQLEQWYVSPAFECGSERSRAELEFRVTELAARDLSSGDPQELSLRLHTRSTLDERDFEDEPPPVPIKIDEMDSMMLCGLARAQPMCTAMFLVSATHEEQLDDGASVSRKVTASTIAFGEGRIAIELPAERPSWPDGWPPAGTFELSFAH